MTHTYLLTGDEYGNKLIAERRGGEITLYNVSINSGNRIGQIEPTVRRNIATVQVNIILAMADTIRMQMKKEEM